jgi:hypothetical protein
MSGFEGFIPESNRILQLNYISTIKPLGGKRSFLPPNYAQAHILNEMIQHVLSNTLCYIALCGATHTWNGGVDHSRYKVFRFHLYTW